MFAKSDVQNVVISSIFPFYIPCCHVRYDFRNKTTFGSSRPSVVCRRAHVLFTLSVFVLWIVVSNTYCVLFLFVLCNLCWQCLPPVVCRGAPFALFILFCVFLLFFLCLVYPMLPISLDCPFVIASSVFSNVFIIFT
jgi:sterol desaturase/sphingolipid hydroxylase (fatty acid hydroxylase superfamily)